ncbi:hypothetical protein PGT21_022391 [Puccinia graminis f. sp. tritici]|uniref:Tet-like 2OG-Fe(II) oxygenase domain-containing protein n=1 Tax=Puccinia graminis f. sp. tritici TaxID=56615 RepID=A0A5B0PHB0_PUCGR|nr:hypothetical protein PGT21_022391 [Puccinia graminis f. sp. tritici]
MPPKPEKPKCTFIPYIQFTRSEDLSEEDKNDLDFITTFLYDSTQFVNPVDLIRKIFRGKMWTIGWRKSQTRGEVAGRYIDTAGIPQNLCAYLDNLIDGISASDIIHKLFYSIADAAVDAANVLLTSLGLPGYCDPNLKRSNNNCFASNLAFTRDEFSNRPHCDDDKTKTAFLLLSNINREDGTIALTGHKDSTFTGPFFVFPHHRVAIDLRKLNGICRVVFDAGKFEHCTHNAQPSHPTLTSFGFSLQITKTCVDAFQHIFSGFYDNKKTKDGGDYYIGDHNYLYNKVSKLVSKLI